MKKQSVKFVKFGYGVVDCTGAPYWDESCVCEDRAVLDSEIVSDLNAEDGRKNYRTVALYYKRKSTNKANRQSGRE